MSEIKVGGYVEMDDGSVGRVVGLNGKGKRMTAKLKPLAVGTGPWAWWEWFIDYPYLVHCAIGTYLMSGECKVISAERGQQIELEARLSGGYIQASLDKHSTWTG